MPGRENVLGRVYIAVAMRDTTNTARPFSYSTSAGHAISITDVSSNRLHGAGDFYTYCPGAKWVFVWSIVSAVIRDVHHSLPNVFLGTVALVGF